MMEIFPNPEGMAVNQLAWTTATYGYILYCGANMMSDGSELLLFVPQFAGIIGSIVIPVLGAVPDGIMVLFSGLGDPAEAQEKIGVGVGTLAGSTIMLLTIPWFMAVLGGRVDIKNGIPDYTTDQKLTHTGLSTLTKTGVKFRSQITANAKIMLITSLTYLVIQVPAFYADDQKAGDGIQELRRENACESMAALTGMVLCFAMFMGYLYLQYLATLPKEKQSGSQRELIKSKLQDWMQWLQTKISGVKMSPAPVMSYTPSYMIARAANVGIQQYMADFRSRYSLNSMDAEANRALLSKVTFDEQFRGMLRYFFGKYADPRDVKMSRDDFDKMLKDLRLHGATADVLFGQIDADNDGCIDNEEFVECFKLLATLPENDGRRRRSTLPLPKNHLEDDEDEDDGDENGEQEDIPEEWKDLSPEDQRRSILRSSFYQMGLGTLLVIIFSDPMVDVLSEIGRQSGISSFYIAFVIAPLASNAGELIAAFNYASKKTPQTITIALSTLEGAACMNNTMGLGIFFALIYFQGLAWKFTAETITTIIVQLIMFILVMSAKKQNVLFGLLILMLFPGSLFLVWFLENKVGLD
mmetsp:Transcript_16664/g.35287  ORF Transcript_16664/g.35287 Transcript_16664/m.35287 type:complete len:583 (-) Transcript_16664:198-1946(-)